MRKAILYILFILLLLAAGTLAYGFYNAKQIRNFAKNAQIIEMNNDFDGELQEVEKYFKETPNANAENIQQDSLNYKSRLDQLVTKTQAAKNEIESLRTPPMAHSISDDLRDYYRKAGMQARELSSLVVFMNQIFGVSEVFQEINESTSLDDIKNIINEAQNKSDSISADMLPESLKGDGTQLVTSTKNFLITMQDTASQRKTESQSLDSAYVEFSKAEDQFSAGAVQYIRQMENLNPLKNKIDSELPTLGAVYFSLK